MSDVGTWFALVYGTCGLLCAGSAFNAAGGQIQEDRAKGESGPIDDPLHILFTCCVFVAWPAFVLLFVIWEMRRRRGRW